jgi:hypothetical protein
MYYPGHPTVGDLSGYSSATQSLASIPQYGSSYGSHGAGAAFSQNTNALANGPPQGFQDPDMFTIDRSRHGSFPAPTLGGPPSGLSFDPYELHMPGINQGNGGWHSTRSNFRPRGSAQSSVLPDILTIGSQSGSPYNAGSIQSSRASTPHSRLSSTNGPSQGFQYPGMLATEHLPGGRLQAPASPGPPSGLSYDPDELHLPSIVQSDGGSQRPAPNSMSPGSTQESNRSGSPNIGYPSAGPLLNAGSFHNSTLSTPHSHLSSAIGPSQEFQYPDMMATYEMPGIIPLAQPKPHRPPPREGRPLELLPLLPGFEESRAPHSRSDNKKQLVQREVAEWWRMAGEYSPDV